MAFGDVVRARRTELAIGLNDLAERMGISPGYWSRIERNLDKPPSDEVVQRVLSPFVQADASIARAHGGTGLGLCIAANLVSLMGTRLEA